MSATVTVPDRDAGSTPQGKWRVRDTNARVVHDGKVQGRTHEILPGISYTLYFDTDTPMPEEHARRFLIDEAFIVLTPDGTRLVPFSEQVKSRDLPPSLKANQVVASLDELTHDALMNRSLLKPGAPKFSKRTSREVMIEFLTGAHEAEGEGRRAADGGDDADDLEEMNPNEVDSLLTR